MSKLRDLGRSLSGFKFSHLTSREVKSNKRDIKYIAIHCAATPPDMEVTIERIDKWHRQRGFNSIGYHFVIYRDGSVHRGRDISETGAHVAGYNSKSIGICYAGGVNEDGEPEDNRTETQKKAMRELIVDLLLVYSKAKVQGHRDFPNVAKACPSFDVAEWLTEEGIND